MHHFILKSLYLSVRLYSTLCLTGVFFVATMLHTDADDDDVDVVVVDDAAAT